MDARERARRLEIYRRLPKSSLDGIRDGDACGCLNCKGLFSVSEVDYWFDGQVPACPYCGTEAVVGSSRQIVMDRSLLWQMVSDGYDLGLSRPRCRPALDKDSEAEELEEAARADRRALYRLLPTHRDDLMAMSEVGCFWCLRLFSPKEVEHWDDYGKTGRCPWCGSTSIMGPLQGKPLDWKTLWTRQRDTEWHD